MINGLYFSFEDNTKLVAQARTDAVKRDASRRSSWPRRRAKGYNMTGWRCAAILGNAEAIQTYWRLKTNVDSGLFEAVQMAGAAALQGPAGPLERMNETYARRRDLVVSALREIGVEVTPRRARSTSGRRCPRVRPRPPSARRCWKRQPW